MALGGALFLKAFEFILKYSKDKLESNAKFALIMKDLGLDVLTLKPDFQSIYINTLVRYAENRNQDIVRLFVFDEVIEAFREEKYEDKQGKTLNVLDGVLNTRPEVRALKSVHVILAKEMQEFDSLFDEVTNYSRSPAQLQEFQMLHQLNETMSSPGEPFMAVPNDLQAITHEHFFQHAPNMMGGFIDRKERTALIDRVWGRKSVLYLHGVTRTTKSFLVSQYIRDFEIENYYWYDFKVDIAVGIEPFFRDLSLFVDSKMPVARVREKLFLGELNPAQLASIIGEHFSSPPIDLFVLDNVHCIENPDSVFPFLGMMQQKSGDKLRMVLISEDRHTLNAFPDLRRRSERMELNGFDEQEIKDLMKANACKVEGIDDSLLTLIKQGTSGHPDLVNGLIAELKTTQSEGETLKVVFNKLLNGWKNLAGSEMLTETLASRIYDVHLKTVDEKRMFNRLCTLIGPFSKRVAEFTCGVNPTVADCGMVFQKIQSKLLDTHPNSTFAVPDLFKRVGEKNLSEGEKHNLMLSVAEFLFTPENGVVNGKDAVQSLFYSLGAGELPLTFERCRALVVQALFRETEASVKQFLLRRLELFVSIKVEPKYYDTYLPLCVAFAEAYKQVGELDKQRAVVLKIVESPKETLDAEDKFFVHSYILQYYVQDQSEPQVVIESAIELANLVHGSELPESIATSADTERFLSLPIYASALSEIPNIGFMNTLISSYVDTGIELESIFTREDLVSFFEVLYEKLAAELKKDAVKRTEHLKQMEKQLTELREELLRSRYHYAVKEVSYLLGCISNDFGGDPDGTLNYFNEAQDLVTKHFPDDSSSLAKILVGKSDLMYYQESYDKAAEEYEKAITSMHSQERDEFLYLHASRRIAVCLAQLGDNDNVEEAFFNALKAARAMKERRLQNVLEAVGDMSTYYILTTNRKAAAKCFAIMVSMLDYDELQYYKRPLGHCLGWFVNSSRDNWDGKLVNLDGTHSEEEWIKPFYGIYGRKIDYEHPNQTKANLLFLAAEGLSLAGLPRKSDYVYRQIVESPDEGKYDVSAKFLATIKLFDNALASDRFNDAVEWAFKQLEFGVRADQVISKTTLKDDDFFDRAIKHMLIPLVSKCIQSHSSMSEFKKAEQALLYFVIRSGTTLEKYREKFEAFSTSAIGWLYASNIHLSRSFIQQAGNYIAEGNQLAESAGYPYVLIQNRIFTDFSVRRGIPNLKKFLVSNFRTFRLIIQYWKEVEEFIDTFWQRFSYVWTQMNLNGYSPTKEEEKIIYEIKATKIEIDSCSVSRMEKSIVLAACFARISTVVDFGRADPNTVFEFCVKNLDEKFENHFPEISSAYIEFKKKKLDAVSSSINSFMAEAEIGCETVSGFLKRNGSQCDTDTLKNLQGFLKELKVASGHLGDSEE